MKFPQCFLDLQLEMPGLFLDTV